MHAADSAPERVSRAVADLDDVSLREQRVARLFDLTRLLTWREGAPLLASVDDAYLDGIEGWLRTALALPLEQKVPDSFVALLGALPQLLDPSELRQFLRLPRLRQLTLVSPEALSAYDLGSLLKLLYGFCVDRGKIAAQGEGVWAPLGERFIEPGVLCPTRPAYPAIDVASNFAIPLVPDLKSTYVSDTARAEASASHLHRAIALLEMRVPEAAAFLRTQADVFVLRFGEGMSRDGLSSGSCHEWLGAIFLINADSGPQIVERVAESAVHEAIHTQIDKIEETTVRLRQDERTIVSPWSGNAITTVNYIHACIVWFGLLHLWRRLVAAEACEPACLPYLRRAEAGFVSRKLMREQHELRTFIDPLVVDLLVRLEEEVADGAEVP